MDESQRGSSSLSSSSSSPNSSASTQFANTNSISSGPDVLLQMSINGRNISSGLRRQPTKYPHGLGISVAIENEPSFSVPTANNWPATRQKTKSDESKHRKFCISSNSNNNIGEEDRPSSKSSKTPETHPTVDPQIPSKISLILMEYLKTVSKWKFVKWPVIVLSSVLLLFGLIAYFIWLSDNDSAARNTSELSTSIFQESESYISASPIPTPRQSTGVLQESTILRSINSARTSYGPIEQKLTTIEYVMSKSKAALSGQYEEVTKRLPVNVAIDYTTTTTTVVATPADPVKELRFTSGHQNSFGIPIEEDERILRLINGLLSSTSNTPKSTTHSVAKVSPTIPPIVQQSSLGNKVQQLDENGCASTSLPMCHGILQYDLTTNSSSSLSLEELDAYQKLIASNCSARAVEFVCSTLEPECRPSHIGILPPCKRICKSILEACSIVISSSDTLTATFDCDLYPDSSDPHTCEDPTRRRGYCYDNEFECFDRSCIPHQWHCDNIKDCSSGEDEDNCLLCDQQDEFRCRSNEKCVPEAVRCDLNFDCFDGSDEEDCEEVGSGEDGLRFDDDALSSFPRLFSYASFLSPNQTNNTLYTYITAMSDGDGTKIQVHEVTNQTDKTLVEDISNGVQTGGPKGFVNFRDSKEIMMTSDTENKFKYSDTGGNETLTATVSSSVGQLEDAHANSSERPTLGCTGEQLRCVSGKCITVDQLCDKVVDCSDGADELMCVYNDTSTVRNTSYNVTTTTTRITTTTTTTRKPETTTTRTIKNP